MNFKRAQVVFALPVLILATLYFTLLPSRLHHDVSSTLPSKTTKDYEEEITRLNKEVQTLRREVKLQKASAHTDNVGHCIPSLDYHYQDERPLNLVFLTNPIPFQYGGQISEALWIRDVVVSKLQRPVLTHYVLDKDKHETFFNDSLVVALFLKKTIYFEGARAAGVKNIGLYWMGDEVYQHDQTFLPLVDYVFRNYYHKELIESNPHVHWLPNGIKSCLGSAGTIPSTLPLASQRKYLCNFLGSLRSHRKDMLEYLKTQGIECAVFVNKWEDKHTQHPIMYRFKYLEHSKFTLCPFGNNPETMRHYEALEHGSIPIVFHYKDPIKDPLKAFGDGHPLPTFKSFYELPAFFQSIMDDPEKLNALQRRVLEWWLRRRDELMIGARNVIEDSFTRKYGKTEASTPQKPCTPA